MSAYHIDLGELEGDLIAVDGNPVQPVRGRTFPITVAQRLDIALIIPKMAAAYPVLSVLEGERNRRASCSLLGSQMSGAFPDWPTRHHRRSLSALSVR
jgi:hypothetical protein